MITQRIQKLQGHADWLLSAFLGLRLNYGLLKPILGDLEDGVPQPPPRVLYNGLAAIRTTLFRSCVLDLVRLAWDDDSRAASAANLMKALQEPEVIHWVVESQATSHIETRDGGDERVGRHLARIEESNAEVRRRHVRQLLEALNDAWSRLEAMPSKKHFIAMRDKHIAHLEVRLTAAGYEPLDIGTLGVRRRDLAAGIVAMEEITRLLNAALRDSDFLMARTTQMFDSHGERFWMALQK